MTDAKEYLRELAKEIRAIIRSERNCPTPSIEPAIGNWFAAATYNYLRGNEPDLEKALGLKRGPGHPRQTRPAGRNYERAKKIFWMRSLGRRPAKSWTQIADAFPNANLRDLQRELKRYTPDIIAEISAELASRAGPRVLIKRELDPED